MRSHALRCGKKGMVPAALLAIAAIVSPLAGAQTAAATAPTWNLLTTIASTTGTFAALSCPTTTTCFAVGKTASSTGVAATTTTSGASWKTLTLPAAAGDLDAVTCSSVDDCFVAGKTTAGAGLILATTDGGTAWTTDKLPSGAKNVLAISCPTAVLCVAGSSGGGVLMTADGGSVWSLRQASVTGQPTVSFSHIDCPTALVCYADGNPSGDGSAWVTVPSPTLGSVWRTITGFDLGGFPEPWSFGSISCPGTSVCYITAVSTFGLGDGEFGVFAVTGGGSTVTFVSVGSDLQNKSATPGPIACASETTCWAFLAVRKDSAAAVPTPYETTNGTTWTASTVPSTAKGIVALACASQGTCDAVGPEASGTVVVGLAAAAAPSVGGLVEQSGATKGGASVTVYGSGFATGDTVDFGKTAATGVSVLSASSLDVTAPAGTAGTVTVTVSNASGTSSGVADADYTYLTGPPTITAVSPPDGATYGGEPITINGTGVGLATAVEFGTVAAVSFAPTSASSLIAVAPAGTGVVDVRVTDPGGTSATGTADHFTFESSTALAFTLGATFPAVPAPSSVTCVSSTVCYAAGPGGILRSADTGNTWGLSNKTTAQTVACQSTQICVATVAGGVVATTDGGIAWTSHLYPAATSGTGLVACPSSTTCDVAVGSSFLSSTNHGATWTSSKLPSSLSNPSSLSCPASSVCVLAAPGELGATSTAGASWTAVADPSGTSPLRIVSCASASDCMAVGASFGTTNAASTSTGGASWTALAPVDPTGSGFTAGALDCVSSTECLIGGSAGFFSENGPPATGDVAATADDGSTWTIATVPAELYGSESGMINGLSCDGIDACAAVGTAGGFATNFATNTEPPAAIRSVDGGVDWTEGVLPTAGVNDLTAVSCLAGGACEASGDSNTGPALLGATSATGAFSVQGSPAFAQTLAGASCPTASECVAVGVGGGYATYFGQATALVSTDEGALWQQGSVPGGLSSFVAVSCGTASVCVAAGDANEMADTEGDIVENTVPALAYSSDGGLVWNQASAPSTLDALYDVSCPPTSATTCFAAGYSGDGITTPVTPTLLRTTDGGAVWRDVTIPSLSTEDLTGVSCVTTTTCVAVGGGAIIATVNGTTWSVQTVPTGVIAPASVWCATALVCVGVGDNSNGTEPSGAIYTSDGGTKWSVGTTTGSDDLLDGVSCTSATDCVATGSILLRSTDGGATWASVASPSSVSSFTYGVGCFASGTVCVAAGAAATNTIGIPPALLTSGDGGSSWTAQGFPLAPVPGVAGSAVSCVSATTCVAGGASFDVNVNELATTYSTTDSGALWSSVAPILQPLSSGILIVGSIACVATICDAADGVDIAKSTDNGDSWVAGTVPTSGRFSVVSCASATDCVATGTVLSGDCPICEFLPEVFTSSNGGASWRAVAVLPGGITLSSLSCPTTTTCVGVGALPEADGSWPVAAFSSNGGVTWTETSLPAALLSASSISCITAADCVAVATEGSITAPTPAVIDTSDGGVAWTVDAVPTSAASVSAVACSSTSACVAVGDASALGGAVLHT